jgi:hypothetical protein
MSRRRTLSVAAAALATALTTLAGCTDEPSASPSRPSDTPSARPTPTGPMPTASPAGEHVLGLKWNWTQHATLDYAADTGGGSTFAEVEWCAVEPVEGQRDWTRSDSIVRRSKQLGHDVMLKIRTGQCWATEPPLPGIPDRTEVASKTPSTPPVDEAAYEEFVTELVRRYAAMGVHTYAVENEPDVFNFWAGEIADYEELVRLAAPVIRAADPDARILEAGLSSTGYGVVLAQELIDAGDADAALETYLGYYGRRMAGGASRWASVSDTAGLAQVLASDPAVRAREVFDAATRLVEEGVVDVYQLHFYEETSRLPELLALVRSRIGDAAVEGWEVGVAWPGDGYDPDEAAAETTRLIATLLADGVSRVIYLPLAYTPGNTPQVFRGLVDESGEVLPAGEAFRLISDLLVARTKREFHRVDDGTGLRGVVIDRGPQGQAALLWAASGTVSFELEDGESATDHRGGALEAPLEVGADPVVVTSEGASLAPRLTATG